MATNPPAAGPDFQRFETRPAAVFITKFQDHIGRTARPETFPGLHPGPIGRDEPFIILSPISLHREKRGDGTKAPCPMCQPNKYYEGKLAYFPSLQAVAAIGHCCAHSSTRTEAERRFKQEQAAELALDALLTGIPLSCGRIATIDALLPIAHEAKRVFDCFRRDGGWYQKALRTATKSGGALVVTEVMGPMVAGGPVGMRTSGSTVETRDITFGMLEGRTAVATRFSVDEELTAARAILAAYDAQDDDDILTIVAPLTDGERQDAAAQISWAVGAIDKARRSLVDFRSFFSPANAERISRWGTHPEAPSPMKAVLRSGGTDSKTSFQMSGAVAGFWIVIEKDLWRPVN